MATQTENTETNTKPTLEGDSLPTLLRQAREASGLTQQKVVENLLKMGEAANQGSVQKAETGRGPEKLGKAHREAAGRGYRLVFKLVPIEQGEGGAAGEADPIDDLVALARRFGPLAQLVSQKAGDLREQLAAKGAGEKRPARRARTAEGGTHGK